MTKKPFLHLMLAVVAVLVAAESVDGQLSSSGSVGDSFSVDTPDREEMKQRIEQAPWNWGRARVQPRLGLGQAEYTNNIFDENDSREQMSELRASAHAGLEIFLPAGSDSVLSAFARPTYQWWKNNDQLSRFNSNFGVAAFGFFNRASTQISARRTEVEQNHSTEVRIPVTTRQDRVGFDGEIEIRGPWRIFGSVAAGEIRYPTSEDLEERIPGLSLTERDVDTLSLGIGYDIPGRFEAGLGWRQVETDFLDDPEGRSNSGDYPFIRLVVVGNRLQVNAEIGQRLLEFEQSSGLSETEETVGILTVDIPLGNRTNLSLYGSRKIVYSALDASAFFASQVNGVSLGWGDGVTVGIFAESGEDEYTSTGGVNLGRLDSGESYGASIGFPLRWGLVAQVGYNDTTIDSNFDQFDRSGSGIGLSVKLDLPDFPF